MAIGRAPSQPFGVLCIFDSQEHLLLVVEQIGIKEATSNLVTLLQTTIRLAVQLNGAGDDIPPATSLENYFQDALSAILIVTD